MSWVQRRQPPRRRGQNRGTRGGESGLRPAPQRGHERDAQTFDGLLGESSQVPAVLFEAIQQFDAGHGLARDQGREEGIDRFLVDEAEHLSDSIGR
jgi:hypothetical protein